MLGALGAAENSSRGARSAPSLAPSASRRPESGAPGFEPQEASCKKCVRFRPRVRPSLRCVPSVLTQDRLSGPAPSSFSPWGASAVTSHWGLRIDPSVRDFVFLAGSTWERKVENLPDDVSARVQAAFHPQGRWRSLTLPLVWEGDSELSP